MEHLTLEQKLRAAFVSRWHIVKTTHRQSVAEHSFAVAMIALFMWEQCCAYTASPRFAAGRHLILDKALHHDLLEVLTGDVPSPYKRWHDRMFGRKPSEPAHLLLKDTQEAQHADDGMDKLLDAIVVAADRIEAYAFIKNNACSRHGLLVSERLYNVVCNLPDEMPLVLPSIAWRAIIDATIAAIFANPEEISDDDALA